MYTAQGRLDRSQLIEEYLPVVRRQALALLSRLPAHVELDDLIQAGSMGLLDAVERFDASEGGAFSAFASKRVRGAMLDELRSRDWLPRSVRRAGRNITMAIRKLEHETGRAPTEREIAHEVGIPLAEYQSLLNDINCGLIDSYQEVSDDDMPASRLDESSQSNNSAENEFSAIEDREFLMSVISTLPEREQQILALYYQEEMNLKEIGAILDISESRVCQLHSQTMRRLRAKVG